MNTLFRGLEAAFDFFGGVPREILFDQMRSVILRDIRHEGGPLVENPEFLRFAQHWGFRPRASQQQPYGSLWPLLSGPKDFPGEGESPPPGDQG